MTKSPLPSLQQVRIGVIGLGYVGLPLAAHLARKFPVVASISMKAVSTSLGAVLIARWS